MKARIVFVVCLAVAAVLGYGEPVVNSFGGVLFPAGNTAVELRELSISLRQRGERMHAEVEQRLYNPRFEQDLTVGFLTLPFLPAGRRVDSPLEPNIEDLRAAANGERIGFTAAPIVETEFSQDLEGITELSFVYYASVRMQRGENTLRISYSFLPSRDATGSGGQTYYPFTVTPAGLWAGRGIEDFSLRIEMEEGSTFTVPRNLGTPAQANPWRLSGVGKMSRSDMTPGTQADRLYVYLKSGALQLEQSNYTLGQDLMLKIYNPLDHVEPLKSMYWRVYNGRGLEPYTPEDLRIARNTLFAFHGYKFQSSDLYRHFSRYFWYDPDPGVPNSTEILTGSEQALLRYIMGQETLPGHKTSSLSLFLEQFRRAVLDHELREVVEYLDPDYLQDRLQAEFGGNRRSFLQSMFGGIDPARIDDLEYQSFPDGVADDKVVARFDLKVGAGGSTRTINFQIRRAGNSFRLIGVHGGVTNYDHRIQTVRGARALVVDMRSVGDPYVRCYSTWIEDGSGGWINLDGSGCGPGDWKASHCSCPTVMGSRQVRYDLSRFIRTPYTGKVVVAVSSYVGYWRVDVKGDAAAPPGATSQKSGRPWSTATDTTQRHAEVKDIRYSVSDGILRGEATFVAWNRSGCPACIQQIVLISEKKTGGLYDAVCIDLGIPGVFPGREVRRSFTIRYPDADTRIWAFPALQYTCEDAVSLARQNFRSYKEGQLPIIAP